jgi:hypothetical protein
MVDWTLTDAITTVRVITAIVMASRNRSRRSIRTAVGRNVRSMTPAGRRFATALQLAPLALRSNNRSMARDR